jgi:hypothetical protein
MSYLVYEEIPWQKRMFIQIRSYGIKSKTAFACDEKKGMNADR